MNLKLRNLVLAIWLLFGIVGYGFGGLSAKFSNSVILNPQVPDPISGFTVPFDSKGRIVYITSEQQHYSNVLDTVENSIAVFLASVFFLILWLTKKSRSLL